MSNPMESAKPILNSNSNDGLENKESLKPIVNVAYRDNDLFRTLVPKITEKMIGLGRKVIVHSFPQGTPKEEIKKYFQEEKILESLKGTEFLADGTCDVLDYNFSSKELKKEYELDRLSAKIMGNSIVGKEVFEGKERKIKYSAEISALQNIIKKIISEHGKPENFYIVENEIGAHNFGNGLFYNTYTVLDRLAGKSWSDEKEEVSKLLAMTPDEFVKTLEVEQNYNDAINLGFDKDHLTSIVRSILSGEGEYFQGEWNSFIASKIKESLKEIMSEEIIKIVPEANNIGTGSNNYVLIDRHAEHGNYNSKIKLPLPFSSMMDDIIKNKILSIDFDVDQAVDEVIEKTFNKQ